MLRKLRLKQKKKWLFLIKKTCNYMEQDSTKNRAVLVKTDRVSKYTLSVQKLLFQDKYKSSSKKYYSFIILVMPTKNESIDW